MSKFEVVVGKNMSIMITVKEHGVFECKIEHIKELYNILLYKLSTIHELSSS